MKPSLDQLRLTWIKNLLFNIYELFFLIGYSEDQGTPRVNLRGIESIYRDETPYSKDFSDIFLLHAWFIEEYKKKKCNPITPLYFFVDSIKLHRGRQKSQPSNQSIGFRQLQCKTPAKFVTQGGTCFSSTFFPVGSSSGGGRI